MQLSVILPFLQQLWLKQLVLYIGVTVQTITKLSSKEALTLSLYCSLLRAAWFWLSSVSRSRLHPSWEKKSKKRGDDEAHPQRDRYVMERLMRTTLREGSRGGGRGGETESHSAEEGKRGYERQRESKSFSQLHRDRLSDLNCVLCTSQGL